VWQWLGSATQPVLEASHLRSLSSSALHIGRLPHSPFLALPLASIPTPCRSTPARDVLLPQLYAATWENDEPRAPEDLLVTGQYNKLVGVRNTAQMGEEGWRCG